MRLARHRTADDFLAAAGSLLTDAPDVLLYGLAAQLTVRGWMDGTYLATVHDDGGVVAAAMRTPRRKILLTPAGAEVCALIAQDVVECLPDLDGVLAEVSAARAFAGAFTAGLGRRSVDGWAQRLLVLDSLRPPAGVAGLLRLAEPADAELLSEWADAFQVETQMDEPFGGSEVVRSQMSRGVLFVWDDAGPRSMAAAVGRSPRAARIGAVYTPPAGRSRGYASAAVAALTRRLLDDGCTHCSLFTQAHNPTSKRLYERIGYVHVADYQDICFEGVKATGGA